jgi:DUF1365 family protein
VVIPAIYFAKTTHLRKDPMRHGFTYSTIHWLVDVDNLPSFPGLNFLVRFKAADHVGDPNRSISENVRVLLREHGIDLGDSPRILMLSMPRSFGLVFNPLSVFWCFVGDELRATVAEVHNTYGDEHAYVIDNSTVESGRIRLAKAFYVSPFNEIEGSYELNLPFPDPRLELNITLHREGREPFTASLYGKAVSANLPNLSRAVAKQMIPAIPVWLRIRKHGLWLWAKGLPVVSHK